MATRRTSGKARKNEGQILVLMALLSTTLIVMFGMVVGVGHLVQARMNLQNAVDLAAMSGASWQARYLDAISLVNYRLRQNYKFMLYDLYVTQSRFNGAFRDVVVNSSSSDPFEEVSRNAGMVFGICQQSFGYHPRAPGETGNATDINTDMCKIAKGPGSGLPPIQPLITPSFNPMVLAAQASILMLAAAQMRVCTDSAGQNLAYFNYITARFTQIQKFQMQQLAKVLQSFNADFDGGTFANNSTQPYDLMKAQAIALKTIQNTFTQNLISASAQGIVKLELINPGNSVTYAASSGDITNLTSAIFGTTPPASFNTYFDRNLVKFSIPVVNFENAGGCKVSVQNKISADKAFLGISRSRNADGSVKTPLGIAIRAVVQPHLLFWPQGLSPTLVAVGIAKPFGSRIGASFAQTAFETMGSRAPNENQLNALLGAAPPPMANMSFYPGDDASSSGGNYSGVGHKKILKYLFTHLPNPGIGVNEKRPTPSNADGACDSGSPAFMCLATAPTLYESLFWNTYEYPPNSGGDKVLFNMFPWDSISRSSIELADGSYAMPDRGGAGGGFAWHKTSFLGGNSYFRKGGTSSPPVFFGDEMTVRSSYSPDFDPRNIDPTNRYGGTCGADGSQCSALGRVGYQIKLVSADEFCADLGVSEGGAPPGGSILGTQYCGKISY